MKPTKEQTNKINDIKEKYKNHIISLGLDIEKNILTKKSWPGQIEYYVVINTYKIRELEAIIEVLINE